MYKYLNIITVFLFVSCNENSNIKETKKICLYCDYSKFTNSISAKFTPDKVIKQTNTIAEICESIFETGTKNAFPSIIYNYTAPDFDNISVPIKILNCQNYNLEIEFEESALKIYLDSIDTFINKKGSKFITDLCYKHLRKSPENDYLNVVIKTQNNIQISELQNIFSEILKFKIDYFKRTSNRVYSKDIIELNITQQDSLTNTLSVMFYIMH